MDILVVSNILVDVGVLVILFGVFLFFLFFELFVVVKCRLKLLLKCLFFLLEGCKGGIISEDDGLKYFGYVDVYVSLLYFLRN